MKKQNSWFVWDRYTKIEWFFFIAVFIVMPFLINVEDTYRYKDLQPDHYYISFVRCVVGGIFRIIPVYLLYKIGVQNFLIKKRYGWFLVVFLVYFLVVPWFSYAEYWTMQRMSFLPAQIVAEATAFLHLEHLFQISFYGYTILLFELGALGYYIHYEKQARQISELRRIQAETDLQYLKAQIQPHFFFNTLNNIYSLALQHSDDTAPLVAKLSDMMRYVLYEAEQLKVPLTKEADFLRNYINLQSVRYNKKIDIRFDTQGITDTAMIEPLVLLPFVENAFKHGTEEEEGHGFIEIVLSLAGDELTLFVSNSRSISASDQTPAGIGIKNTEKRLSLLYPSRHTLNIRSTESTYTLVLSIILN